MRRGLINYSSLARLILKNEKLEKNSFDAVLVGGRRYEKKLPKKEYRSRKTVLLKVTKKGKHAEIIMGSKQKSPGLGPYLYFLLEENEIIIDHFRCEQEKVVIRINKRDLSKAVELLT